MFHYIVIWKTGRGSLQFEVYVKITVKWEECARVKYHRDILSFRLNVTILM